MAGGSRNGSAAALYNPASGSWSATGSLNVARIGHTATLLPNGKVLVVGGAGSGFEDLPSAELYDPTSETWTFTGSLNIARVGHTATLLPNGMVLVAGGEDVFGSFASAELYNPATGSWAATDSLNTARSEHTATLLPNGKVLVARDTKLPRARSCTIRRAGLGLSRAASTPHVNSTRRRCCPTARCWWQEDLGTAASRERGTIRSGHRELECNRQPQHSTLHTYGDPAAKRQGAGGGGTGESRER